MIEWVDRYQERGWEVLRLRGKQPMDAWLTPRRWTREQIKAAFRNCNIGIVTGARSGVVVLDCDTKEAEDYVLKNHPTGKIVETGRGIQLYYELIEGIQDSVTNAVDLLGIKGLDRRARHGCATAPPSIHASGKQYRWLEDGEMAVYEPDWFPESEPRKWQRSNQPLPETRLVEIAKDYVAKEPGAVSGQRGHHKAMSMAGFLVQKLGLPLDTAFVLMEQWNAKCEPPWSERELMHKLEDALKNVQ